MLEMEVAIDATTGDYTEDADGNLIIHDRRVWVDIAQADRIIADIYSNGYNEIS